MDLKVYNLNQAMKMPEPKKNEEIKYDSCTLPDYSALLRDNLALDRTIQANERTFLAYIRTSLTMFVAGVTFIRFFGHVSYEIVGWAFLPASTVILAIGLVRYRKMRRIIRESIATGGDPTKY